MKMKSLSRVRLLATPWTAAYQASPSMGFSKQKSWSGVPLLSPRLSSIKVLTGSLLIFESLLCHMRIEILISTMSHIAHDTNRW